MLIGIIFLLVICILFYILFFVVFIGVVFYMDLVDVSVLVVFVF